MQKGIILLALLSLLTSLGCQPSADEPRAPGPNVVSQPEPQPADGAPPSDAAERVWRSLEYWGDEADTTGAPTWAGIDSAGRLVLGAEPDWDYARHNQKYVPLMFQTTPLVERVLVWSTEYRQTRPLGTEGYFSVIERATYEGWPESEEFPFPMEEWGSRVDRHAERHGELTGIRPQDVMALSERWVTPILGDRLSEMHFAPYEDYPNSLSLYITVNDPDTPEQDRVVEAAILGGLPVLTGVPLVEVRYPGAPRSETIETTWISMVDWYGYAKGDPKYHAGWLTVDGVMDKTHRPENYLVLPPEYSPNALIDLMEARPRLEAHLPDGAELLLGRRRGGRGIVAVEATVPTEWAPEQRWAVYSGVVDKIFAEGLDLEHVYLILSQGNEVEVIRAWKDTWSVRSYLTQAAGRELEPITLPLMAQWYDRYTMVDR